MGLFCGALAVGPIACGGAGSTSISGAWLDGGTNEGGSGTVSSNGGAGSGTPGGTVSTLPCGSTFCSLPGEVCCVSDPVGYACVAGSTCPAPVTGGGNATGAGAGTATALSCSGAANCDASTVCCVFEMNRQVFSECMPACPASGAQLCDPSAPSSGCTAATGACSSQNVGDWGLPHTYATCGGVGN